VRVLPPFLGILGRLRWNASPTQSNKQALLQWRRERPGILSDKLLANGAQANTSDDSGDTPLKVAQENHNALIVNLLKKAGAKK
jgi:ankyrin repeat protein